MIVLAAAWAAACAARDPGTATPAQSRPAESSAATSHPVEQTWQIGPLRVTRSISHRTPLVSDLVAIQLEVQAPREVDVRWRQPSELPQDVESSPLAQTGPEPDPNGRQIWRAQFHVEVLAPGTYRIAGPELEYRGTAESDWVAAAIEPAALEFRSLLGEEPDPVEPKPNPGPASLPRRPPNWLAIALVAAAAVAAALVAAFLARRLQRHPRPAPRISAYRKAMNAIDRIERAGWLEKAQLERFYTELSAVVRHYVEDRFGLHAPEQTTEEFLEELRERPLLDEPHQRALGRFLEQSDLVKFARVCPSAAEGQAALRAAREFVQATRDDSVTVEALGVER